MKTKESLANMKNIRKEKGITLVALVVTIVVLLILAGITITLVFSENGIIKRAINAKGANEEGAVKEEIALALLQMRADKYDEVYNLENIKIWLPEYLENRELGELSIESGKILGQYKGYEFEINNKFDISYIGKVTGIRITYTLSTYDYTKNDIILTVSATSTEGTIESIEGPEGLTQNQDGIYTITKNGTYKFTATDSAENDKDIDIEINTIDRLDPKDFTPIVKDIKSSSLTIIANAEDDEPKTETDGIKSGIDRYEYYLTKKGETTSTKYESISAEYIVDNLDVNTEYSVYVIAYDKANNPKTSTTIKETTLDTRLDYPVLTANGMMNCIDDNGNYYYEPGVECKASDAINKLFYDRNMDSYGTIGISFTYFLVDSSCWGKKIHILSEVNSSNGKRYQVWC